MQTAGAVFVRARGAGFATETLNGLSHQIVSARRAIRRVGSFYVSINGFRTGTLAVMGQFPDLRD